jgi:glycosyltransferase involved in cell wall biosynthesis
MRLRRSDAPFSLGQIAVFGSRIVCRLYRTKLYLMAKIRIIEASNELGLGGTENVVQLYSKYLNKDHFEVTVVGIRGGGERVKLIEDLGVRVIVLNSDMRRFAELLRKTDVFHWHGDGTLNPEIFTVVKENKPRLVMQTNVFGNYDGSALYDVLDYDLFVSKMILVRRIFYDQQQHNHLFLSKRKVLHNPIDVDHIDSLLPSTGEVLSFKEAHQLKNCFVVGRIGRADGAKFDFITLDAFAQFAQSNDAAKFLLVGATDEMRNYIEYLKIEDLVLILPNTSDLKELLLYYSSLDVFLGASQIGESFGIVLAEAMATGVPVLTISTPNRDNAQIEVVDHNDTGLVVERNAGTLCAALKYLFQNEDIRTKFSAKAKQKMIDSYDAKQIVGSLENLVYQHFKIPKLNPIGNLMLSYSEALFDEYVWRANNLWK